VTPDEIAALPVGSRLHNPSSEYLTGADWVRQPDGWHLIEFGGDLVSVPVGHDWSAGTGTNDLRHEAADLVLVKEPK
jgi:hypothetical protein